MLKRKNVTPPPSSLSWKSAWSSFFLLPSKTKVSFQIKRSLLSRFPLLHMFIHRGAYCVSFVRRQGWLGVGEELLKLLGGGGHVKSPLPITKTPPDTKEHTAGIIQRIKLLTTPFLVHSKFRHLFRTESKLLVFHLALFKSMPSYSSLNKSLCNSPLFFFLTSLDFFLPYHV